MADGNITVDVLNMDVAIRMREALAELVRVHTTLNDEPTRQAAFAAARAALAEQPSRPCRCDEQGIGEPGVTCGDCPRDYGHRVAEQPSVREPLSEFKRMQIIGEEFPLALVEPIVIRKIDAVCRAIERAHGIGVKGEA